MRSILGQVINDSAYYTPEQKIAIAVYLATLDVMREEELRIEKYAQILRDAVDLED